MKHAGGLSAGLEHLSAELRVARVAAERAGAIVAERWQGVLAVRLKGAIDLVTEVDLAAEAAIVETIRADFPDDPILTEEAGALSGQTGRRWYVDPLDGTTNYSHGFPHFCVSIAAVDSVGGRVAVIYEPLRGWAFTAMRGHGAHHDGEPIRVSSAERIGVALLATGFPYDRHHAADNNSHRFTEILRRARGLRRAGSAALDLAYVARGWLDGYWEDRLNPWDLAAGALLVKEAGGTVSRFGGAPFDLNRGQIVAANGRLHGGLVEAVAQADRSAGFSAS